MAMDGSHYLRHQLGFLSGKKRLINFVNTVSLKLPGIVFARLLCRGPGSAFLRFVPLSPVVTSPPTNLPYLDSLCHILLWHYAVVPFPGLAFPCPGLDCSVVPLPCHAFGLRYRSASPLTTVPLATVMIRSCYSLAVTCPSSSGPALAIPFQCRADLFRLCLSLGCPGPA